jgi:hypothetical protein
MRKLGRTKRKQGDSFTNGFFKVPRYLIRSRSFRDLSPSGKVLFYHLLDLRNEMNMREPKPLSAFYHTDTALRRETGMEQHTLRRARRELVSCDLLCVHIGRYTGSASTYIIQDDCCQESGACEWPF